MSDKGIETLTEQRFVKLFGRLQRELGNDIERFYLACGLAAPDVWMDDTRALAILAITQEDVPSEQGRTVPATWWQMLKRDHFPVWVLRLFPVRRMRAPCEHMEWDNWSGWMLLHLKDSVRLEIEKELDAGSKEPI